MEIILALILLLTLIVYPCYVKPTKKKEVFIYFNIGKVVKKKEKKRKESNYSIYAKINTKARFR